MFFSPTVHKTDPFKDIYPLVGNGNKYLASRVFGFPRLQLIWKKMEKKTEKISLHFSALGAIFF